MRKALLLPALAALCAAGIVFAQTPQKEPGAAQQLAALAAKLDTVIQNQAKLDTVIQNQAKIIENQEKIIQKLIIIRQR